MTLRITKLPLPEWRRMLNGVRFVCLIGFVCTTLRADEAAVRKAIEAGGPLPAGVHEITREIALPAGVLRGAPGGTTLRAAKGFAGRAILTATGLKHLTVEGVEFDGNRKENPQTSGFPPSNVTFAEHTRGNGLVIERSTNVTLTRLRFREIGGYAAIVSASSAVTLTGIVVQDSGSRLPWGRNNGTGGVLFEDGTSQFQVTNGVFERILGNAVWTHSRLNSPRNRDGVVRANRFDTIGRDAIQIGHATGIRVDANKGTRIGYPHDAVDTEGGGIPVAIDTAGNVDESAYNDNQFTELNGKCIDLDGFHHGEIARNVCTNTGTAAQYPSGHYGIVFNNNNPQMRSENVKVHHNTLRGMKYGAVFLLGSGHQVYANRFLDLNRAKCPESHAQFGCLYFPGQPDLLSSGVYLGVSAADWSRQEPAAGNTIIDNEISGYGMKKRCVMAAPTVAPGANTVARNVCRDGKP